jgi:pimeloyl-ACP methyl ester carboxylesterase
MYPLLMPALADLAAAVLDTFAVAKADVLGYSHGGAVAQQLSLDHPSRINRLILGATTPGVGAPVGNLVGLANTTQDSSWPRADSLGVTWRLAAIATWSSLPRLPAITAPTLVIAGANDEIIPLATSQMLASLIPGATLEILDADHDLQTPDAALLLAHAVTKFLSS